MAIVRVLMLVIGVLAVLMGLLWIGQGTGIVHWPASSFMLDVRIWMVWGALLALFGAMLIGFARRRR